ncbi:MAG: response regulator [Chroococcidiopsidaceae cyanobacterium CP_BM_ER_R8_30]|nr:response regulator [Chroococcidiopsidaceae cyanobacterium CP_BM_ER_R8_30]
MGDEQLRAYSQEIWRRIATLPREDVKDWQKIAAALEDLHVLYEEMQTSLETAEIVEETLLKQNQRLTAEHQRYYDLFHAAPFAYLVTDANGIILEANQAIAQLLNVPQPLLVGKPFAVLVAEDTRRAFRIRLSQLSQTNEVQIWEFSLCPRKREPFVAQLHVALSCNQSGLIEALRIGVYDISQYQQRVAQLPQQQNLEEIRAEGLMLMPQLPQSLDGLHVLVVDDEADVREFITAVFQSCGIRVMAVANAAAALEALEEFHPDVLLSDIRMPNGDGYSLIRQIRAWESSQRKRIPAAAITAYLDEDREKALSAGFEAHLHKLAQPTEWIEMVAQLAGQASRVEA